MASSGSDTGRRSLQHGSVASSVTHDPLQPITNHLHPSHPAFYLVDSLLNYIQILSQVVWGCLVATNVAWWMYSSWLQLKMTSLQTRDQDCSVSYALQRTASARDCSLLISGMLNGVYGRPPWLNVSSFTTVTHCLHSAHSSWPATGLRSVSASCSSQLTHYSVKSSSCQVSIWSSATLHQPRPLKMCCRNCSKISL